MFWKCNLALRLWASRLNIYHSLTSAKWTVLTKLTRIHTCQALMQKEDKMVSKRLDCQFYDVDGEGLARALLGQKIVRMVDGTRVSARIVETEAYLGGVDKAAHTYKGQTERNRAVFMQPGTAYVYTIYGMYHCFNISCQGAGCAVLIRSVEPVEGVEKMGELRKAKRKSSSSTPSFKVHQLANGPAKLCQAMAITKQHLNQRDLVTDTEMWLEEGDPVSPDHVVRSARINIAYAEEWTDKPLRCYVLHNPCVSVRNKAAEKLLLETTGAQDSAIEKQTFDVKAAVTNVENKTSKRKTQTSEASKLNNRKKMKTFNVSDEIKSKEMTACDIKIEGTTD